MNKSIGVLGGTFDPVHNAHLHIALDAVKQCDLEKCLLLPNNIPPHRAQPTASNAQRLAMLTAAIEGYDQLAINTCELERDGASYMIDTLKHLKQQYPQYDLALIIGADSFITFDQWHLWQDILHTAQLIVFNRPGYTVDTNSHVARTAAQLNPKPIVWLDSTMNVSSTDIRQQLRNMDKKLADEMPQKVLQYIQGQGLYQT